MERQWLTLDQIKAEYASNDYNPELLLQHLLHHVEARSASVPEGWKHSCNALCLDGVELLVPQCPHCGKPAPTPPASEDKDKIIASLQAKIDALMLEYCPEEMPKEQMDELARHQEPVSEDRKDAEIIEQCRINGIGAEREAALLGKVAQQSAALKLAREALEYYDSLSSSLNFNFDKGAEALAAIDEVIGE